MALTLDYRHVGNGQIAGNPDNGLNHGVNHVPYFLDWYSYFTWYYRVYADMHGLMMALRLGLSVRIMRL